MNTFDQWGAARVPHLQRAEQYLPRPDQIGNPYDPTTCWNAIFNTTTGSNEPGRQILFLRTYRTTHYDTTTTFHPEGTNVSFRVHEPVDPADTDTFEPIGTTGFTASWTTAKHLAVTAARTNNTDELQNFTDILTATPDSITDATGNTPQPAALVERFGTAQQFAAALRSFRTDIGRRVLSRTFDIAGVPMSIIQILHVHDGLWRGPGNTDDIYRLLQEVGITGETADTAIKDPVAFVAALTSSSDEAFSLLQPCGRGSFSYHNRVVSNDILVMEPHVTSEQVGLRIHEQLFYWGIGCDAFDEAKFVVKLTPKNYSLALLGYDIDPSFHPRKETTLAILQQFLTVTESEAEREAVRAVIARVGNTAENAEDFPNLLELVAIGMNDAVATGSRDWIGRRGLGVLRAYLHCHLVREPNRVYKMALAFGTARSV